MYTEKHLGYKAHLIKSREVYSHTRYSVQSLPSPFTNRYYIIFGPSGCQCGVFQHFSMGLVSACTLFGIPYFEVWLHFQYSIKYVGCPTLVWIPDPSGRTRKGLGNNLARKCLAGMPLFLNSANFIFRSSTRLVRYYSNF